MAAQVGIPEAAMDAAMDFFREAYEPDVQHALKAAAPLIIAAELRRFADELLADRAPTHGRDHGTPAGLARIVRKARERADLLDPEGRAR